MITSTQLTALKATPGFGAVVIVACVFWALVGLALGGALVAWWYSSSLESMRNKAAASDAAVGVANSTATGCQAEITRLQANARSEREKSDALVASLAKAEVENDALRRAAANKRAQTLATPIRGATEGEQCVNAVNDHFRGAR